MHVGDIGSSKLKQCRFQDAVYSMTGKTISKVHVHVSPGSAETLVKRGGMPNHYLMAYCLSNISAQKLPKLVDVC